MKEEEKERELKIPVLEPLPPPKIEGRKINGMSEYHYMMSHKPTMETRENVMALRIAGYSKAKIARILKIGPERLNKHYSHELELADGEIDRLVVSKLISGIKAGNPKLIEFYLKNKKGWSEKREHVIEHKVTRTKEELEEELLALGVPEERLRDI